MKRIQESPTINTLPDVYSRNEHDLSRSDISPEALKVLYRLKEGGYDACLVGGAIRDILLGRQPKDFDVVTNATPEEVRKLFRNCILIGRRFRLAHIYFGRHYIEVATYRQGLDDIPHAAGERVIGQGGLILRDNLYGTLEEDAYRRDFTINGLYYRLADFSLVDYVDAVNDMSNRVIRSIGDPLVRFPEDPVRMLRAIRFAIKLDFSLDPSVAHAIALLRREIHKIAPARLFDEVLKLLQSGQGEKSYHLLQKHDLFHVLFPICLVVNQEPEPGSDALLIQALKSTDTRLAQDKSVNPAFIFAAILWAPLCRERMRFITQGLKEHESLQKATRRVLTEAVRVVGVPRRFTAMIQEIWALQGRLEKRSGNVTLRRLREHPRFRAAYDFLALRGAIGEVSPELVDWWTTFQYLDDEQTDQYIAALPPLKRPRRRKKTTNE